MFSTAYEGLRLIVHGYVTDDDCLNRRLCERSTSEEKVRAHLAAVAFCLFLSLSAIVECELLIRSRQCCNYTLMLPEPKALAARRLWAEWRRVRKDNEWERRDAGFNDGVDITIIKKRCC
jgi:hypothetical protein